MAMLRGFRANGSLKEQLCKSWRDVARVKPLEQRSLLRESFIAKCTIVFGPVARCSPRQRLIHTGGRMSWEQSGRTMATGGQKIKG
jgi:hypothetical protein